MIQDFKTARISTTSCKLICLTYMLVSAGLLRLFLLILKYCTVKLGCCSFLMVRFPLVLQSSWVEENKVIQSRALSFPPCYLSRYCNDPSSLKSSLFQHLYLLQYSCTSQGILSLLYSWTG